MASCLVCLDIIQDEEDAISIKSEQWQKLKISEMIEKHFWSVVKMHLDSWVCVSCWKEINNFHKFFLRIEKAHVDLNRIKSECGLENEMCKEDLNLQISHNKYDEETVKDSMEYCFLEPEILINQNLSSDMPETIAEISTENKESTDDILSMKPGKSVLSYNDQADSDPLEKSECNTIGRQRKRKRQKIEGKKVKQEPEDKYDDNESDDAVEGYDEGTSTALTSEKMSLENKKRGTDKSCSKSQINREESDKIIGEYFKQMNCDICQMSLENLSAIHKHFLEIHQQKKGYIICCDRKFFNRRVLVDHIHCHLNPDHFKCVKCDKVLSDRKRLEKHELSVHGSEEVVKKHCCDKCGKSFVNNHYLSRHKFTHMSEDEKKFPCKECGKFYGSSDLLHRHMQAVHLRKFVKICYICGKSYSSSTELKIHIDKHEGIPQPEISCDVCGLRLTTERGLKRHKDSQHPVDGKKDHHCPICPKISPTLKALRKHVNTMHKKGYDHKCTICQKAFKRAEVLREHMASHTGTPLYTCPWCPKTFNSNGNMHAHRKKMHPKEWEEAKLHKYSGNLKPNIASNDNST